MDPEELLKPLQTGRDNRIRLHIVRLKDMKIYPGAATSLYQPSIYYGWGIIDRMNRFPGEMAVFPNCTAKGEGHSICLNLGKAVMGKDGSITGYIVLDLYRDCLLYTSECTGMTFYQNRLPGELSGGQRQRVALARAIVGKPSILLMDEPLSALDAELKIEMRKEIQDIHKITGATIIYVTHDQSEALAMADRIIIMKDGHIEQVGTPKEIYMEPKTSFAATFVSKCNLLEGSWMGSRFKVAGEDLFFEKENVAQAFLTQGVYPIRPEQFHMEKEGLGLKAVVTNKQYNGCLLYTSLFRGPGKNRLFHRGRVQKSCIAGLPDKTGEKGKR